MTKTQKKKGLAILKMMDKFKNLDGTYGLYLENKEMKRIENFLREVLNA